MSNPPPFGAAGSGSWEFVQTIAPNEQFYDTNLTYYSDTQGGLDTSCPYLGHSYSTDGLTHTDSDSPGFTLPGTLANINVITESFQTTIMYEPPAAASPPANVPSAVQWVPLKLLTWSWSTDQWQPSQGTYPNLNWLGWVNVDPAGTGSPGTWARVYTYPKWSGSIV